MIKNYIEKIAERKNLTLQDAYNVMHKIMSGEVNEAQIAALLIALKTKGETPEEVAGFALAMRNFCVKICHEDKNMIDVCGTGGDGSNTFNISTAVSFVVAGAGIKVAKHGNRSISSKSGSADVLTELGININLSPSQSEQALTEIGIAFLFAPNFHPAMKYAAPVRKALGIKTIFNILGPLTNPAGTKKQLIGVYNLRTAQLMAEAAKHLDMEKVYFVNTLNSFDEISLTGETDVIEYSSDYGIKNFRVNQDSFGYTKIDIEKIQSDSILNNSKIMLSVLKDKIKNEAYYVVAANAALALHIAGNSDDLIACRDAAEESILSGKAFEKLNALKKFGEKFQ
ncbi:MAG: anthranilate phosphoribosyltransferase [Ignavibacteriales bacterium]|nr:anthranilate phosphoribosyltransferase [Ignavibacteriales bacterium]